MRLFLVVLALSSGLAKAQVVDITTIGIGNSPSDAENSALRSALEQCYGVFLSSKSELIEGTSNANETSESASTLFDDITTITSGEIVSYEVLEQTTETISGQPTRFHVVIKAVVSIDEVATFVRSKGVEVEIEGGLFAKNIKLLELNELAEITALNNMVDQTAMMLNNSVDFEIQYTEPTKHTDKLWRLDLTATARWNSNIDDWINFVPNTLSNISCSEEEAHNRWENGQPFWRLQIQRQHEVNLITFRTPESIYNILDLFLCLKRALLNFKIDLGLEQISGLEILTSAAIQGNGFTDSGLGGCARLERSKGNAHKSNIQAIYSSPSGLSTGHYPSNYLGNRRLYDMTCQEEPLLWNDIKAFNSITLRGSLRTPRGNEPSYYQEPNLNLSAKLFCNRERWQTLIEDSKKGYYGTLSERAFKSMNSQLYLKPISKIATQGDLTISAANRIRSLSKLHDSWNDIYRECLFYRKPPDRKSLEITGTLRRIRDVLSPDAGRQQELVYIPWRIDRIKEPIGHGSTYFEKKEDPMLQLEDNVVVKFPLFFTLEELEQLKTIQISSANLME